MVTPPSLFRTSLFAVLMIVVSSCVPSRNTESADILTIQRQGSMLVGGTVKTSPGRFDPIAHGAFDPANASTAGQTLHGDHAFVFYQVPVNPRPLPLVFWHGYGQSMKTWQTTPDGREGFQTLFLRRRYPVYLLDQPGRGLAGRTTRPGSYAAATDDQRWFGIFRLGEGTTFYPGVQFSQAPVALDQFYRQMTPDTGPLDIDVNVAAVSALFDTIGPAVLVTHSHSGGQGWLAVLRNDNIRAIASFEPGSNFVFPEGEVPESIDYVGGRLNARGVPMDTFRRLTEIPIVIYYGDYIPDEPVENPGQDQWRAAVIMARRWAETVNRHGGDVTLIRLPELGLHGNTHFPMSDLNNTAVARLLADWLAEKNLD
ncbi:alpha/beta fold hydrolase [Lewinella sp. JB7]|uniref:alpha/beta hydrolase n=1 Tax=Lewinella sp. JB7 TaxID=2962887 RepID=UPI0020C99766|nr:alpha/beta fold hydrolase [Lewinella sp. JB7]MCP9235252.1 alpha/beta fold hydrolase [Lewinella sp. JB7]